MSVHFSWGTRCQFIFPWEAAPEGTRCQFIFPWGTGNGDAASIGEAGGEIN